MQMAEKNLAAIIWAYPWDFVGIGVHSFLDLVEETGFTGVSVAASYHGGLFVTPHHPHHRLYFPEDGVLYFHPVGSQVKKLSVRPRLSKLLQEGDPLRELSGESKKRGIKVNSWFVATHNTALGKENPHLVLRNAFGDPLYFALCPSHPKVQEYLVVLLRNLTATYAFDGIDLESLGFLGLPHGYHHEKDLVGLNKDISFLLSLCFCPSCLAKAKEAGVDGKGVRDLVQGVLEEFFKGEKKECATRPFLGLKGLEEFQAYLKTRVETVQSLAGLIRRELDPGSSLNFIEWGPPHQWWREGFDKRLGEVASAMIMCSYERNTSFLQKIVLETLQTLPQTKVFAGIQAGYPTCQSAQDVRVQIEAAKACRAHGVQVYHFGLIRRQNLEWLRLALSS